MQSEDTRGEKEEEAKLELTFFAKLQEGREEEDPERLLDLRRRKEFFVSRRIDFARFRDENKLNEFQEFEDDGNL